MAEIETELETLFLLRGEKAGLRGGKVCAAILNVLLEFSRGNVELVVKDHCVGPQLRIEEFRDI